MKRGTLQEPKQLQLQGLAQTGHDDLDLPLSHPVCKHGLTDCGCCHPPRRLKAALGLMEALGHWFCLTCDRRTELNTDGPFNACQLCRSPRVIWRLAAKGGDR